VPKIKDPACLNCGHPFYGQEKFCPDCGQANKANRITFKSFIQEVFNGFISWDSKFWITFIPLLTKPGKVSRDYIDGKRQRYANPFRFYLTISVLFFLIIGATESYDTFKELRTGKTASEKSINDQTDDAFQKKDSLVRKELLESTRAIHPDSIKKSSSAGANLQLSFFPDAKKYYEYQKKHPEVEIERALDNLKTTHTFFNRFMYSRFQAVNKIGNSTENQKQFTNQIISYISISLFIFLPLFTLSLKLFYLRRKYTYVEHLVFVFHTQTVFFLLLTLFYILNYFKGQDYIIAVFLLLFLVYLYLAMKGFYKQGPLKTFIKFILVNVVFLFISTIGSILVTLIAFAFY
tara:strand:- start:270 stop:1316 length:1047 start_codon:yes stop_codon:yes gene_type:complete